MTKTIAERVRALLAEQLSRDLEEVVDTADLIEDLGADSLDHVELVFELEGEFDIEIPDDEAENYLKVGHIIAAIEKKVASA